MADATQRAPERPRWYKTPNTVVKRGIPSNINRAPSWLETPRKGFNLFRGVNFGGHSLLRLLGPIAGIMVPSSLGKGTFPSFSFPPITPSMPQVEAQLAFVARNPAFIRLDDLGIVVPKRVMQSVDHLDDLSKAITRYNPKGGASPLMASPQGQVRIVGNSRTTAIDLLMSVVAQNNLRTSKILDKLDRRQTMWASMLLQSPTSLEVSAPFTGSFGGYPVRPNVNDFLSVSYVRNPNTGMYELQSSIDTAAYFAAQSAYLRALDAAALEERLYQDALLEHQAAQASYDAWAALQGRIKRTNTASVFVVEPQAKARAAQNLSRARMRQRDKKAPTHYGIAHVIASPITEGLDVQVALFDNLTLKGIGNQYRKGWAPVFENGRVVGHRPVTLHAALSGFQAGIVNLNWTGFLRDLAINELEDRLIGAMARKGRTLSQAMNRPLGVYAGPLL